MEGISCLMATTARRRWCLPWSIRWWQAQTHEDRELIVAFDGPGTIDGVIPVEDDRIKVIHLVRDPLKVLNSWFSKTLQFPELTSAGAVAKQLWGYNDAVSKSKRLIYRHRVEAPLELVIAEMDYKSLHKAEVSKDTNTHNRGRCNFSWEDLRRHEWCERLREQYRTYGYQS